ncbi:T. brucei spp.-specific protein [Trypanosoma brucei gambiense DAL972]|uniref:T. brucei spp.-specific protein n=1 Tax=Trypanosoma brucei gambiense (strain MHOM/CI/86/DAL972) TaxID=679716 RepID=D0A498_TRYB9|nr:T. brucei spp.-specific protein [Trypanosoma brucei gambiense DAL972]CBH16092.1 T. brucei spp.-specific protein [Trypanosoma brucei gambiense DAL972]|eukprot:XP_011778356.1 T. brucei spp.-specific protein [Trypanosoma brucei gambiense DAL972]
MCGCGCACERWCVAAIRMLERFPLFYHPLGELFFFFCHASHSLCGIRPPVYLLGILHYPLEHMGNQLRMHGRAHGFVHFPKLRVDGKTSCRIQSLFSPPPPQVSPLRRHSKCK